jgi:hypothetical protein
MQKPIYFSVYSGEYAQAALVKIESYTSRDGAIITPVVISDVEKFKETSDAYLNINHIDASEYIYENKMRELDCDMYGMEKMEFEIASGGVIISAKDTTGKYPYRSYMYIIELIRLE